MHGWYYYLEAWYLQSFYAVGKHSVLIILLGRFAGAFAEVWDGQIGLEDRVHGAGTREKRAQRRAEEEEVLLRRHPRHNSNSSSAGSLINVQSKRRKT